MSVRILGFVNHIAPAPDIEESIARALQWGVDVIVAQGTGSDWGPYWLGSGQQAAANVAQNVRPYLKSAVTHDIPFVFSFGIAGANEHLDRCLAQFQRLCRSDGVLGVLEPNKTVTGHEAAVVFDCVAETRELAEEAAYFGFIRLFIGPYPGRLTTAGNAAAPFMPVVIPVSDVYTFSIYHLLPLADPVEPFPTEVRRFGAPT